MSSRAATATPTAPSLAPALGRVVVIGGSGAVGSLFTDRLRRSGAEVCVIDRYAGGGGDDATRFVRGDVADPSAEVIGEVSTADLVLLAVPEPVALVAIPRLAGALQPHALLADTASVKSRVVDVLVRANSRSEAVSLNPMFAPALGFAGHPVAAVIVRGGRRGRLLLDCVREWGAQVVTVTADQHDRVAAASQALTHATVLAFGIALDELEIDVADLDRMAPPPSTALLSLLARIACGTPEVYWDVQAANPYAQSARQALARGLVQLTANIDEGDPAAFERLLERLRGVLGPSVDDYRRRAVIGLEAMTANPLEGREQ
jgi:prephenate dehydrogenase